MQINWNVIGNFNGWQPFFKPKPVRKIYPRFITIPGISEAHRPNNISPFSSSVAFGARLKKKGFVYLGGGHYSTVFGKPNSNRVIKVSRIAGHDAWLDYCLWAAKKGYAGTLAPRVYSYKVINGFAVAIMERMAYTGSNKSWSDKEYLYSQLFQLASQARNEEAGKLLDIVIPGAKRFGQDLYDEFKKGSFDLHNANIMFRQDGSMCVTDPVCHPSSLKVKRLRASDFGLATH